MMYVRQKPYRDAYMSSQAHAYAIPFEVFYRGLSTDYNFIFRRLGYAEGGYVFIQLQRFHPAV
jgi:hypothetical protein